jgi:hypothetical protein
LFYGHTTVIVQTFCISLHKDEILELHAMGHSVTKAFCVLQVLQPLVQDLKALEEGVDGMKAGILAYSADNLEVHDLGMFQRNFNSGYPCHYCLIPYRQVSDNLMPFQCLREP